MEDEASNAKREYLFQDGKIRIVNDGKEEVLESKATKLICEQMNAVLSMALSRV